MSKRLNEYLIVERRMLRNDIQGFDNAANRLREQMEMLWLNLSDEEREFLGSRDMMKVIEDVERLVL